jgi:Zn-dependent peptidase ImmA (M78 family)
MVAAFDLHEDLKIDTFFRVDVFETLAALGLRLLFRPLQSAAALYLPKREGVSGVIINAHHPLAMQRYSGGHELGHHIFDHGPRRVAQGEDAQTRKNSPEERLAEAFSSWFLMPPEAVEACLDRLGLEGPASPAEAYALSLRLGVSYSALCTHLPSLKLASPAVAEEWRARPLKSIKEELSTEPPLGGWQNDTWLLTPGDAERELVVRSGDRLLVEGSEHDVLVSPEESVVSATAVTDLLAKECVALDIPTAAPAPTGELAVRSPSGTETRWALRIERPQRGRYIPRGLVRT